MHILAWLLCMWVAAAVALGVDPERQHAQLRFDSQKRFKVVQLTDLHLGENSAADSLTLAAVRAVLLKESDANLVVLSGDMVSGFKNTYSRKGWFAEQCVPSIRRLLTAWLRFELFARNSLLSEFESMEGSQAPRLDAQVIGIAHARFSSTGCLVMQTTRCACLLVLVLLRCVPTSHALAQESVLTSCACNMCFTCAKQFTPKR